MNTAIDPAVWTALMTRLAEAGNRLAARVAARSDPADTADLYLTMLGTVMDSYLNQLTVSADHPAFVPCTGYFQRLGSPNPDTVYRRAPIDATGTYRLTGVRGTAVDATIMPFAETMRGWPPFDLSAVTSAADGTFDVIISGERPAGHLGHWWKLEPGMAALWLRAVSDKWDEARDPAIAIVRLDSGTAKRMSAETLSARLNQFALRVERTVEHGVRHVEELIEGGFVNAFKEIDYSKLGAMPSQSYHEGLFDFGDDHALLVEAQFPDDTHYFSWALTDSMLVTLDWMNSHTSLNKTQARRDADGILRVVLSATDPGVSNWMQTTGFKTGVLQARSIGSRQQPVMRANVIPLAALADHLPADTKRVTPAERKQILHKRQIGAQMRRLW